MNKNMFFFLRYFIEKNINFLNILKQLIVCLKLISNKNKTLNKNHHHELH